MIIRSDSVGFIAGRRRWGKSYYVKTQIWPYLKRVIFHDRKWEHADLATPENVGLAHTLQGVTALWKQGIHKIVYQPTNGSVEDFDAVCGWVFDHGNIFLIVDEAPAYVTASTIPQNYADIIRMGSTRGVGVVSLTQRPRDAHNTLISEADFIISFRLQLETDCQKIAQVVGPEAMKLNSIPKYHYMAFNGDTVTWCRPVLLSSNHTKGGPL